MTSDNWLAKRQATRKSKKMRTVRIVMSPIHFEQLVIEAKARVMTSEFLARALLEHILRDHLIEAVLDDGKSAPVDGYNPADDFAKSIDLAYETIRARKAAGGSGWEPP